MSFWGELKRRDVFKVAAAYLLASWLIVQVVGELREPLNLPDALDTVVVVLLAIGFPFALIIAWVYEVTPEGIEVTADVDESRAARSRPSKRLTYAVIGLLVMAAGITMLSNYGLTPSSTEFGTGSRLAVLPCDDLSPDPTNSYFAPGIHEELLTRLESLSGLEVISRTSVLQYEGRRPPAPQIAKELDADAILECSARYSGDRVRLTAQLVDGASDTHLWADAFPGDMSNLESLFEIQAEIATNVANALHVEFFEAERERIESVPTQSREAYELYLAAQPGAFCGQCNPRAIELLDQALRIDPEFAEAWQKKSGTHSLWYVSAEGSEEDLVAAQDAAARAIDLAPDQGRGYAARAQVLAIRGDWLNAERDYREARRLGHSGSYDVLPLLAAGYLDRARESIERTRDTDPLNSGVFAYDMLSQELLGNPERANETYRRGELLFDEWLGDAMWIWVRLGRGEVGPGHEELTVPPGGFPEFAELLDDPGQALARLNSVAAEPSNRRPAPRATLAVWAAFFGDPQLALRLLREATSDYGLLMYMAWLPMFDDVRELPGFKAHLVDIGLVDFWRATEWPDVCRPTGTDFECR